MHFHTDQRSIPVGLARAGQQAGIVRPASAIPSVREIAAIVIATPSAFWYGIALSESCSAPQLQRIDAQLPCGIIDQAFDQIDASGRQRPR